MKEFYKETVDAKTFNELLNKKKWDFTMPVRPRYVKFLPEKAFALNEDLIVVLEGPKLIRFRKKGSLRFIDRKIRLIYIVKGENIKPFFKIHLV